MRVCSVAVKMVNSAAINNLSGGGSAGSQLSVSCLKKTLKYRFPFTEKERDVRICRSASTSCRAALNRVVVVHFLHLPPECFTEDTCMHLSVCTAGKGACRVCTKGLQCSSMSSSLSSPLLPLLLHCTPPAAAATPPHAHHYIS